MDPNGRAEETLHTISARATHLLRPDCVEGATRLRGVNAKPGHQRCIRPRLTRAPTMGPKEQGPPTVDTTIHPELHGRTEDKNPIHGIRKPVDPNRCWHTPGVPPITNPLPILYLRTIRGHTAPRLRHACVWVCGRHKPS